MRKMGGVKLLLALTIISFLSTNAFAETNVTEVTIYTDSSVKSFDAKVNGWTSIDFDDSYWPYAKEYGPADAKAQEVGYPETPSSVPFYYRKTFELSGTEIMSGKLFDSTPCCVGSTYYVNDNKIDGQDIAQYLKLGKNVIAVITTRPSGVIAFTAKIRVVSASASSPSPTPTSTQPGISDTSPPSISISKQIVDFNKNGQLDEGEKLVITYGANDESGVKSIKVLLDGNLIELRNNEGIYSVTTDSLSVGDHSIVVEAIDSNGNKKSEEMKINVARAGPSVYFPKSRYEVTEGDDFNVVLSAVNPIGNPKMDALLILKPPGNGISTYESDCKGFSGQCTGRFEIEPGDSVRSVSTRMRADRAGEYQIDAEVYYQFENGQRSPTRYETLTVVVKPKQTPNPTNPQAPSTPGFAGEIAIIGILFIALFIKKRSF